MVLHLDKLLSVRKIEHESRKCNISDPKISHAFQEYWVGDGIARSSEIEEDKDGERSRVSCMEEVTGDFNQGCFSTVFWAETRLEWFVEVV